MRRMTGVGARSKRAVMQVTTAALALTLASMACGESGGDACGPATAVVARVIDGDTIELSTGERVRYLMIDTPETTGTVECWGEEAKQYNISRVLGKTVTLTYDQVCHDAYDRLLAYIEVDGENLNRRMVAEGYACVLHIPPNGDDVVSDYNAVENSARAANAGLWGACNERPC